MLYFWQPKKAARLWEALHVKIMSAASGGEIGSRITLKTHRWQAQNALFEYKSIFVLLFCISRFQPQWPGKHFMVESWTGWGERDSRLHHYLTESTPRAVASTSPNHNRWSPPTPAPHFTSPFISFYLRPLRNKYSFFSIWQGPSLGQSPSLPIIA